MKKLILCAMVIMSATSCSAFKGLINTVTANSEQVHSKEQAEQNKTPIEQANVKLQWLMVTCLIFGVITFALGFKIPFLSNISGILFIGAGSAWCVIEALNLIESIKWIIIIAGVCFGGFHIYHTAKNNKEEKGLLNGIIDELGFGFDDPEGVDKLSKEAQVRYTLARPTKPTPQKNIDNEDLKSD